MFEGALLRLPFKAPLALRLIRQSEESERVRCLAVIGKGEPLGRDGQLLEPDESSAPCVTRLRISGQR